MSGPAGAGTVRIGLAQWAAVPGAGPGNLAVAERLIARAGDAGCTVVVLPELWASGYDAVTLAADMRETAEPLDGPRGRVLGALAREHRLYLAAGSVPELDAGRVYNTLAFYGPDGRRLAHHRKFHRYGPSGEPRAFDAGAGPTVCACALGTVGLSVCFDGDFPETGRALRAAGARIVLQAAAYEHGAEAWWERLYPAYALANGQWWVLANQAGGGCFGASRIISPLGEVVAEGPRVAPGAPDPGPELFVADVDLGAGLRAADAEGTSLLFEQRIDDAPVRVVAADTHRAPSATAA